MKQNLAQDGLSDESNHSIALCQSHDTKYYYVLCMYYIIMYYGYIT